MNEEMNAAEIIRELAEENQTRKILMIVDECNTVDEVRERLEALLNYYK